jgi:threonine aldolase
MFFGSDNTSGVHPRVIEALVQANDGYAASYGADTVMDGVRDRIRELFEAPEAAVYLVATGSTANALSLATFCPPWGAIYCHRHSHIEEDECGAPEFYTGGSKLVLIDGEHAKIDPDALRAKLQAAAHVGVHNVQRGMVSITNVTELGAVYTPAEVAELTAIAKHWNLPCHLDGARFANALVATGATPAEMTWRAGIDVLSLGGTKNGLMGVEAVVIFDPAKAWEFELRRKRGGHLFSKHRFLSAQMAAYLADDLWLDLARHANAMGGRLAQGIAGIKGSDLLHPVDANMVFPTLPRAAHDRAKTVGATYFPWPGSWPPEGLDDEGLSCRMVCSWSTTQADVDGLLDVLRG